MRAVRAFVLLPAALLAACVARTPVPAEPAEAPFPQDFPRNYYNDARARGLEVLRVDPAASVVAIEVRRGGPLAGLGHDHVVASRDVQGYVLPADARADLFVPLARLTVDEAGLRSESGMDKPVSADAIEGTRRNMLEKVLEAERFPHALVRILRKDDAKLHMTITLHGRTHEVDTPAHIEQGGGRMTVSGSMTIAQSDFGIPPFSVLGGALQVQDSLALRYRIVALRQ